VRNEVLPVAEDPASARPLDYAGLLRFYVPLAGTDAMRVLSRPITTTGIARAPEATLSLATWPVAYGLSWLLSSSIMALQEVVVARAGDEESRRHLRTFSVAAGLGMTALLGLAVVSPVAGWYYRQVLGVPPDVEALALANLAYMLPLPLLIAGRSFLRGVLISRRQTGRVQQGMFINLASLIVLLLIGAQWGALQGVTVAVLATILAEVIEVVALWVLSRRQAEPQAEREASPVLQ
jgi:hypothetical protein